MSVKQWLTPSAAGGSAVSRFAVGAVAVGTAVFGLPSASWAADGTYLDKCSRPDVSCQTGVKVDPPLLLSWCEEAPADRHYTRVCIQFTGDKVYVFDGASDGHSALGNVFTGAGSVNDRYCRNPHGAGTWAECNFDWVEDSAKHVYGGYRIDSTDYRLDWLGSFSNN
ncbi:hypothetical protein [Micromonospora sp. NPDC047740]|uniref:hypothetical protein n=1 Tax=Micromonospora sp. NPDC047740 TaxID=3364254 RepID=UPI00371AECAD